MSQGYLVTTPISGMSHHLYQISDLLMRPLLALRVSLADRTVAFQEVRPNLTLRIISLAISLSGRTESASLA
jgi:hypothetical protein